MTVSGDRLASETDHRIWFSGSAPCDEHGRLLALASPDLREIAEGLRAAFMLSSKPGPDGYPDEYTKITTYARIISDQARALDSSATPPRARRGRRSRMTAPSPTGTPPPPVLASRPSTAVSGAIAS